MRRENVFPAILRNVSIIFVKCFYIYASEVICDFKTVWSSLLLYHFFNVILLWNLFAMTINPILCYLIRTGRRKSAARYIEIGNAIRVTLFVHMNM